MGKIEEAETKETVYRWDFENDEAGWGDYHHISIPKALDGYLTFKSTGTDPWIFSPASLLIDASTTPVITVRMRIMQGQGNIGQVFFITNQDSNWSEAKSVVFNLDQDGKFQTYNILMSASPAWQDAITQLRFDPIDPGTNSQIAIDYISVHAP